VYIIVCDVYSSNYIILAASTIGPYAVAYTEEKLGGLREFLDGQRQSIVFVNLDESPTASIKVNHIYVMCRMICILDFLVSRLNPLHSCYHLQTNKTKQS
jgi:hypothetical protein